MDKCVEAMVLYALRQPFALVVLPGEEPQLCTLDSQKGEKFIFNNIEISPWKYDLPREDYPAEIESSTPKSEYISGLKALIDSYPDDQVKTVIARKISGELPAAFSSTQQFGERLQAYFDSLPNVLRFAFYHPQTGLWLGSTPELLLKTDADSAVELQALAGTRPVGSDQPWDAKNINEHAFVVKDMIERLADRFEVASTPAFTMNYGSIEHLCTHLRAKAAYRREVEDIIHRVHPTPAICGTPRDQAIERIHSVEHFPREFYTGLISIENSDRRTVYVILRCARILSSRYEIFTGSGIVKDSDPASEWEETEAKAKPLIELFAD